MNLVNTTSKVRKQEIAIDAAALFDILLIAVMMTLLGSKFVASTGLPINLDATDKTLPQMGVPEKGLTSADIDVLSARADSMLIFDGKIYNIETFRRSFSKSKKGTSRGSILIKADKNLSAQALIEICETAKAAGFKNAIIAAKPDGQY